MRSAGVALAACGLLLAPVAACAAGGQASPGHQASYSARWEQPNRDLDHWIGLRVDVASTPGNWRRAWRLSALTEQRFDTRDQGLEAGLSVPLDERWMLEAEAGLAPGAHFLARHSAELRITRRIGRHALGSVGLRTARYRDLRAERAQLSLERYAGAWRVAGTASLVRVGTRHAAGHEIALDRYFGDRDRLGVRVSRGKELVPLPDGVRRFARVRATSIVGRHWLSPRWGVEGALGYSDQSGLYDRAWLQVGVMHAW